ncbi:MAG: hypothetical protein EF812_05370 [Methanosarcinales archaeon]|nr:MAG: hypothetical protein EF812_05370 [Methanosarcinales archaeon]
MNRMHMVIIRQLKEKSSFIRGRVKGRHLLLLVMLYECLAIIKKVVILHFMKGKQTTGEYQFLKQVDNIQMYLCRPPIFLDRESRKTHLKNAKESLKIANRVLN